MFSKTGHRHDLQTLAFNDSVLPLGKPGVLICDLWDHALEPKYGPNRQDYLDAFFNVIDWALCETRYVGFRDGTMISASAGEIPCAGARIPCFAETIRGFVE
ncbi:MAG TPA: Fe-Mn family superoxide dismutase [Pseudolabrys sp.]|jgi:hypothetical protein